ncbi:Lrp/AsnC family transcriptional regulator [Sciscionella sediminilitoris]|uniref:Lrp/AsnC family transcriptional regulator n=1 Tax=Sciscionella sediminilitoris TaxID=1445613 RepID=UPI0004DF3A07|nr:AsnC family transcriptional regulator [Sciscionella sp. SE31]
MSTDSVQDSVDEVDLALINAVQVRPRASWSTLGRALELDPATAARRWERLHAAGLAWVTCVVGPARHTDFCMAYVEIGCAPGQLDAVANTLAAHRIVRYVHQLSGPYGLLIVLARRSPALISEFLRDTVDPLPGVRSWQAELRTVGYSEASSWRLRSLSPAQRHALDPVRKDTAAPTRIDATDQRIYRLLHEDGRMPFTELAGRAEISEPTARRRLNRLLDNRYLRLRCDMAQSISGYPVTAVIRASVTPERLDEVARSLAAWAQLRLCCALTGERNLLLMVWLRALHELPRFEAEITERTPGLRIVDRATCLHTVKQMGRLLDIEGRSIGNVPPDQESFPVR